MDPEYAKSWEGKIAVVSLVDGSAYTGKIVDVCNEYCDKWVVYFDTKEEVEVDEIKSIQ